MKSPLSWIAFVLFLGLATANPTESWAGKGGKGNSGGGDPPPEPVLPPVVYMESARISLPAPTAQLRINHFNDLGMIAGHYSIDGFEDRRACLYDPTNLDHPDSTFDLNELDIVMLDDETGSYADFGESLYYLQSAIGMNNNGLIVGYMGLKFDTSVRRGYVLDIATSPAQLYRLPDTEQGWFDSYPRKVNDNGDILGVYQRDVDQPWSVYLYNLGLRGEASYSIEEINVDLTSTTDSGLSNPLPGDPPKIVVGLSEGGIASYTRGDPAATIHANERLFSPVISENGDIAAKAFVDEVVQISRKRSEVVTKLMLYRQIAGVDEYVIETDSGCAAMNSSGTLLLQYWGTPQFTSFYNDDWGWVDLASIGASTLDLYPITHMNNVSVHGYSEIAAKGVNPVTGLEELVILTPIEIAP